MPLVSMRSNFEPRKALREAMLAAKERCKDRYQQFGAAGQAGHIAPVPLDVMSDRYASGELAPAVH